MGLAEFLARCVNIHLVSGFSIHHLEQPHVGQLFGARIIDLYGDDIMLTVGDLHLFGEIFPVIEVTDDKRGAVTLHYACEIGSSHANVRARTFRMEIEHLSDDIQDMLAAILRRNIFLNTVGEEDHADLVVVLDGREGDRRRNLSGQLPFHLLCRTEVERS